MGKLRIKRIISTLLSVLMIVAFVNLTPALASTGDMEDFYREVSQLISETWSEDYFESIVLQIGNPMMLVDGVEKEIDPNRGTSPIIINGRTMIPILALIEEVGAEVSWDAAAQKVIIEDNGTVVSMQINSNIMYVNDEPVFFDTAPVIFNSRTMLPIRAVTDSLGFEAHWDAATSSATITRDFQTMRLIAKTTGHADFSSLGAETIISGPDNIYVLQFASVLEAKEACEKLSGMRNVVYAEPDLYFNAVEPVSGLTGVSSGGGFNSWGVEKIGADKYAAYLKESGKTLSITVAVLDTGVDAKHTFLTGRVRSDGFNFICGNTNTSDVHGHGTHVSGTIVDCTPGLDNIMILPVKVLGDSGSGTWLACGNGITFAADKAVNVINMSLGGMRSSESAFVEERVQYAIGKNVTVVVSAGNSSDDARYYSPACVENAITVSAVDINDRAAYFTNYGSVVDVGGPGVNIKSSVPGNRYESWDGTSMAAPHVSAAAAMYILNDPTLTPAAVRNMMRQYVEVPAGWNSIYGTGIINMTKAIAPPSDVLIALEWSENGPFTIDIGGTIEIQLYARYANGTTRVVTEESGLYSTAPLTASVSNEGLITGLREGRALINFNKIVDQNVQLPRPIEVNVRAQNSKMIALEWSVECLQLTVGETYNVRLFAVYENGTKKDVTEECGLYSMDEPIATVTATGTITAKSAGLTYIWFDTAPQPGIKLPGLLQVDVKGC